MMDFALDQLAILVAAVGSAGAFWKYVTFKAEQANKLVLNDRKERTRFNEALRVQVGRLEQKVDTLIDEKESLLEDIAYLRSELATANATIKHLEELLRVRR